MKRRDFLELSAMTSAALVLGGFADFGNHESAGYGGSTTDKYLRLKMRGGCRDFRMIDDSIPGFLEREIIDSWA